MIAPWERGDLCPYCNSRIRELDGPGAAMCLFCRRAFDAGLELAVRTFWRGVCEEDAQQHDRHAAYHRKLNASLGVPSSRFADEHGAKATELRRWAGES